MAYPATFTPFEWMDLPSENTPFDKELAQEAEKRLAKFVEEYEVHWRFPVKKESELPKVAVAKGDIFLVEETLELVVYNGTEYVKLKAFVPFWKAPVTKESELPVGGNTVGDVRLVTELAQFFICISTTGTVSEQWKIYEVAPHHWLPPVTKETELPTTSNVVGDVRVVTELNQLFICIATVGSISEQWTPFGHSHTMETPTWVVAEKVASGIIPGPFRYLAASETQTLIGIEAELGKGKGAAEIEYNLERWDAEGTKEWAPIAGLEKLKLKKEEVASKSVSIALHTKDRLRLNILSVSAEAEGLALSAFVEHVAKVS
jgi:hypothetical protein